MPALPLANDSTGNDMRLHPAVLGSATSVSDSAGPQTRAIIAYVAVTAAAIACVLFIAAVLGGRVA